MRKGIEPYLNALHVYCRLLDLGLSKKWAKRITVVYENLITDHTLYQ